MCSDIALSFFAKPTDTKPSPCAKLRAAHSLWSKWHGDTAHTTKPICFTVSEQHFLYQHCSASRAPYTAFTRLTHKCCSFSV